jgi:adenylylsulfate kinase
MSWAIWITGLPGSGKSSIARAAADLLQGEGVPVVRLELDAMRRVVTPVPTYGDAERDLVYRALVWTAAELAGAGVPVIVDATAHRRAWRDLARALIPAFAEVQLTCDLDVCRERERTRRGGQAPRGVYAAAGRPGGRVPGVDVPYEPALAPELTLDTAAISVTEAARAVAVLARPLPAADRPAPEPAWAIWITGLPGSGKTTIAGRAAEALGTQGVRVLGLADLRAFLTGGGAPTPLADEIAHRALAYAAKLLTQAGVPVIVDATAHRREWRDLARALVARFAEVQLVCPAETCATRERAVRWGLRGCTAWAPPRDSAPDVVPAYEPSFRAELVIHTDVEGPWSAVEAVLVLARRLRDAEASAA